MLADDPIISNVQKLRVNLQDFELVKTLATGAVGKVCLVKGKADGKVYAMKILKKTDLLTRREAAFFMEERNALVFARSSTWMTTLFAAFQDEENLYLVMEYASGGSLRSLINSKDDPMSEEDARFYVGEMLLALEELHNMNYIHRDLKPENCLIDSTGHLKLADFGSCMRTGSDRKITSNETVGTPDYISPEILRALEGNVSYGAECDWWSLACFLRGFADRLGIILFELLFDEVPFYAESLTGIYNRIMDHEVWDINSKWIISLKLSLICKKEVRLGRNGAEEIKKHPWFSGFDFSNVRRSKSLISTPQKVSEPKFSDKPPFVPELSGPDDTRYFEDEE
ncbi:kinase-like domain-containing protein, partial [Cladochytrium replicatum]